jgi:alkylhydroperoxidase family enzyme
MLDYAEKITLDASKVTQSDIDALRHVGFTDRQISDIALCAAFRAFVSRFFDATGAGPEPAYIDADETFRSALTVGRKP